MSFYLLPRKYLKMADSHSLANLGLSKNYILFFTSSHLPISLSNFIFKTFDVAFEEQIKI